MATAKIFVNGRSQAVRLPKEFRFEGNEVSIRRDGEAVILEPIRKDRWPARFFEQVRISDSEFERSEQPITPPSPDLGGS